jgi:type III secretion protein R
MTRRLVLWLLTFAVPAAAQQDTLANPVVMLIILGVLAIAPFAAVMLTSFVKVAVVLSIVRNAIGTQQTPPNQVITGLAIIVSIFIMTPVAQHMYDRAQPIPATGRTMDLENLRALYDAAGRAKEPLREFLNRHAHARDKALFLDLAARLDRTAAGRAEAAAQPPAQQQPAPPQAEPPPEGAGPARRADEFRVLIPAFVTSELKEAFQTGFVIYLPFLVVDLVIANILVAMGMSMLQPAYVSLPFKLLLFVLVDGWYLIVQGLVLSYA